ncbi:SDR family NAD(P)-dependent oxidoreductase [Actinomycetospora sp. C-140]
MNEKVERVAVVTGAAAGVGQAVCVGLARRGEVVVGFDLKDATETGKRVTDAGGSWLEVQGDVSDADDVARLFAEVDDVYGRLDILINNAGVFPNIDFEEMTFSDWRRVLRINLDSQFLTCHAAVPLMRQNEYGRIVNLVSSSVAGTSRGYTAYKSSKLGVVGLTRGLAADLGPHGITVNAVSPSLTDTPGTQENGSAKALSGVASRMQAIPKVAVPEDVVGAIAFLASEDAYFITGQTLYSDGGLGYL